MRRRRPSPRPQRPRARSQRAVCPSGPSATVPGRSQTLLKRLSHCPVSAISGSMTRICPVFAGSASRRSSTSKYTSVLPDPVTPSIRDAEALRVVSDQPVGGLAVPRSAQRCHGAALHWPAPTGRRSKASTRPSLIRPSSTVGETPPRWIAACRRSALSGLSLSRARTLARAGVAR